MELFIWGGQFHVYMTTSSSPHSSFRIAVKIKHYNRWERILKNKVKKKNILSKSKLFAKVIRNTGSNCTLYISEIVL